MSQTGNVEAKWVLIPCEANEINMGDQKGIENALYERGMPSFRMTFDQIYEHGLIKPDGQLSVMGRDISVVYFRTGYAENFYKDEAGNWCDKKIHAR